MLPASPEVPLPHRLHTLHVPSLLSLQPLFVSGTAQVASRIISLDKNIIADSVEDAEGVSGPLPDACGLKILEQHLATTDNTLPENYELLISPNGITKAFFFGRKRRESKDVRATFIASAATRSDLRNGLAKRYRPNLIPHDSVSMVLRVSHGIPFGPDEASSSNKLNGSPSITSSRRLAHPIVLFNGRLERGEPES